MAVAKGMDLRGRFVLASCVAALSAALGGCSSGPFGTVGQQAYAVKLNETMARNLLLNVRIHGARAKAKVIVRGAIAGPGPANPAETAQVDRTWVLSQPPPDMLQSFVSIVVSEGVSLRHVYCDAHGQTLLDGRQDLAPFSLGFIGTVTPPTSTAGREHEATLEIDTIGDIPTSTPDPLTGVTEPTAPPGGPIPIFDMTCPADVIKEVEAGLG